VSISSPAGGDRPPASLALQAGLLAVSGAEGPEQSVVAIGHLSAQKMSDCDHPPGPSPGEAPASALVPGACSSGPRDRCAQAQACKWLWPVGVQRAVGRSHCGPRLGVRARSACVARTSRPNGGRDRIVLSAGSVRLRPDLRGDAVCPPASPLAPTRRPACLDSPAGPPASPRPQRPPAHRPRRVRSLIAPRGGLGSPRRRRWHRPPGHRTCGPGGP
jgi:hypothetical protein